MAGTYEKFKTSLEKLLQDENKLAVAVSGGSDSMALALLLGEYSENSDIEIFALTVDHALRPESADEAIQVHNWFKERGIFHHTLRWDSQKNPSNIQAKARKARYKLMADFCAGHGITSILVAHTSNDQAETLLMRLMRGSGLDGLSAIPIIRQITDRVRIIRPLLDFTREELQEYLRTLKQEWIEDPSNKNTKFTRVKVRNLISATPDAALLTKRLADTAGHMLRARNYIEERMKERLARVVEFHNEGFYSVDLHKFKNLHDEERLRFLSSALQRVGGQEYKPRFENLKALHDNIIKGRVVGSCTLWGCEVALSKKHSEENYLFIYKEPAATNDIIEISISAKTQWDGRFECNATAPFKVCALGKVGYNYLESLGFKINLKRAGHGFVIPKKVIYSVPAFIDENNKIIAAPQIGYYVDDRFKEMVKSKSI